MKQKILSDHIEKMTFDNEDIERNHCKWLMELMTVTPNSKGGLGLGETVGQGQRDNSIQSQFRHRLEILCDSKHPDKMRDYHWCPILWAWVPEAQIRAARIFPHGAGQKAMDELFGRPDNGKEEPLEPVNGFMMSIDAEKRIANGMLVIVPNLPAEASQLELKAWSSAEFKDYKVRVLDFQNRIMKAYMPPNPAETRPWTALDGQKVQFRTAHRPRARYLYWQFAVSLLRNAWQSAHKKDNPITAESGKRFWGTGGSWIRSRHLLGFSEYLGHVTEWGNLMEAAKPVESVEDEEPNPAGVILASAQIHDTKKKLAHGWLEGYSDSSDDDS